MNLDELKSMDRENQIDFMRDWFLSNYEDPAERTPYETAEGGYIYIWGGPYDAGEVLYEKFGKHVTEEVINEFVKELESQSYEWARVPDENDYDDYYSSLVLSNTKFHETFLGNIEKTQALLQIQVDDNLSQYLLRLLYASIITALEAFLSDAFINTVLESDDLIRKLVSTNPDFAKQDISLSKLFTKLDTIKEDVKNYLFSQMWHNIAKVKAMYKDTLDIDFTVDLGSIFRAVLIRHDLVHRNGKSKDGSEIELTREDVEELLREAQALADCIDRQFKAEVEIIDSPF